MTLPLPFTEQGEGTTTHVPAQTKNAAELTGHVLKVELDGKPCLGLS